MKVFVERRNETKELDFKGSVKDLLGELGLNPETVIVVRDDILLTSDVKVGGSDVVKVLSVLSGG